MKASPGAFETFLARTNEKRLLASAVGATVEAMLTSGHDGPFTLTDLGAGTGAALGHLVGRLTTGADRLHVNFVDLASGRSARFRGASALKGRIRYLWGDIMDLEIPQSDFILMSHVLLYLRDPVTAVQRAIRALKPRGVALLVGSKASRFEHELRSDLDFDFVIHDEERIMAQAKRTLNREGVSFHTEVKESDVDVADVLALTPDGRLLISFFFHRPFDELPPTLVDAFVTKVAAAVDDQRRLRKLEEYVWVRN